jgi:hypothetical protein
LSQFRNQTPNGALALRRQLNRNGIPRAVEKVMHKRSSSEGYLELAEMCLLEGERTLDRESAERLLTMAGRYLEEAKRIREKS